MLDQAGIKYLTTNENARTIKPMPFTSPANVSIGLKIDEEDVEEALAIYKSIS